MNFLQIKHTGKVKGSIFLSDISGQDNTKQNATIPQYVKQGATLTLQLTDLVLLSLAQGAIAGFIKAGLITASVVEGSLVEGYEGPCEVWVSTEGDDNNSGSKDSPFKTIKHAMSVAYSISSYKHMKTVNLVNTNVKATFYEGIRVNTPFWTFRGHSNQRGVSPIVRMDPTNADPELATEDGYALFITNMSDAAMTDYLAEGGVNYTKTGGINGKFDYTGPDLFGREKHPCWYEDGPHRATPTTWTGIVGYYHLTFENISFRAYGKSKVNDPLTPAAQMRWLAVCVLHTPETATDENCVGYYIDFIRCGIYATSTAYTPVVYVKNMSSISFRSCTSVSSGILHWIFNNSTYITFKGQDLDHQFNNALWMIFNYKKEDPNGRGSLDRPFGTQGLEAGWPFRVLDIYSDVHHYNGANPTMNLAVPEIRTSTSVNIYGTYTLNRTLDPLQHITTHSFHYNSSDQARIINLECFGLFSKLGSGPLWVSKLNVQSTSASGVIGGNMTVSAGTQNVFSSGNVAGNLIVNGGANIDLTNFVVRGNVNLTNAGTVTWKGGTFFGTITDPLGRLTNPKTGLPYEPGDQINVG